MIYQPSDDSFLISDLLNEKIPEELENNSNLLFLEIGAGSGINLETAKSLGIKNILSSDINPEAVEHCRKLGFKCIESDLFKNIKGKFDIIIFNPPYLPKDIKEPEDSRISTTSGIKGSEIITKFLKQAKKHLIENGKIFLITSSLSEKIDFKKYGFSSNKIKQKNLFFEKIFLWELKNYLSE